MDSNKETMISALLVECMNKLPQVDYALLKKKLERLDEESLTHVMGITSTFKNPIVALMLSIFLGGWGIDRFYVGDVGLGILKLITLGGFGIWAIIDWFLIMGIAKKKNINKLNTAI